MQTHHIHSNICEIKNQLTRVGQSTHRQPNYATKFTNPLCCLEFSGWTFNPPLCPPHQPTQDPGSLAHLCSQGQVHGFLKLLCLPTCCSTSTVPTQPSTNRNSSTCDTLIAAQVLQIAMFQPGRSLHDCQLQKLPMGWLHHQQALLLLKALADRKMWKQM